MSVHAESKAAVFSMAASLMVMIYAVGDTSGAHFNPAVAMAVLLAGRAKINFQEAGLNMIPQVFAGMVVAFVCAGVHGNTTFQLSPGSGFEAVFGFFAMDGMSADA